MPEDIGGILDFTDDRTVCFVKFKYLQELDAKGEPVVKHQEPRTFMSHRDGLGPRGFTLVAIAQESP